MRLTLGIGVPMYAAQLLARGGPNDRDLEYAMAWVDIIALEGDDLLYRGPKKGHTGELMAGLIRMIAVMAFFPGGTDAPGGLHFEYGQ